MYFMAFNTIFQQLTFHATNIKHTKPCGSGYSGYTKPYARIIASGEQHVPNHVPTLDPSPTTPFHKRTP